MWRYSRRRFRRVCQRSTYVSSAPGRVCRLLTGRTRPRRGPFFRLFRRGGHRRRESCASLTMTAPGCPGGPPTAGPLGDVPSGRATSQAATEVVEPPALSGDDLVLVQRVTGPPASLMTWRPLRVFHTAAVPRR